MTLSSISEQRLNTCHRSLQILVKSVAKELELQVIEGHRNKQRQDDAFKAGKSKLRWPNSKHNQLPSLAVDLAPVSYRENGTRWIDWNNRQAFLSMAEIVMKHSKKLGIPVRWGGDWDSDPSTPNRFDDLVHFELKPI